MGTTETQEGGGGDQEEPSPKRNELHLKAACYMCHFANDGELHMKISQQGGTA